MKKKSLTSWNLHPLRTAVRLAIILSLSALLVGMRDQYVEIQNSMATKESLSKIIDQINEMERYDLLLHELGQGEGNGARQRLCVLLSDRTNSLKQALETADEDGRDLGNIALEILASHQRQHPDYYVPNAQ